MTEIDGKLCTIAKKEASLVWNCLLVGCWEKKHHYLIHCKNKDQKWCLFFSDQFFTLGKSQIEGKIGIFPWKICTGLEVMAWQQISVIGLLNSLLPHEKYTVWLLMASTLMLPASSILYQQTSSSLCLLRAADRFHFWAISCKTHILSDGTSVAIQYSHCVCICN